MAFPFYGAINSLMASISVPFTAFALPSLIFIYIYRKKSARDIAPLPPSKWLAVRPPQLPSCFCLFNSAGVR